MTLSLRHKLHKPDSSTDIIETIGKYAENFEKIDKLIDEIVPSLSLHLETGESYSKGKKIWNETPTIGTYVGWVNIRDGVHATSWKKNTNYKVGDLVTSQINNGHYYKCTVDGMSNNQQPVFPTVSKELVDDTYGILSWTPSKPYTLGEIVKKTSGGTTFYYRCVVAGTTRPTEPSWVDINGSTIVDGSVTWLTCKKTVWENVGASCEFRPFGKID